MNDLDRLDKIRCIYSDFEVQFNQVVEALQKNIATVVDDVTRRKYWIFDTDPLRVLVPADIYYMGLNPAGDYPEPGNDGPGKSFDTYEMWRDHLYVSNEAPFCTVIEGGNKNLRKRVPMVLEAVLKGCGLDSSDRSCRCIPKSNLYFFKTPGVEPLKDLQRAVKRAGVQGVTTDCFRYHKTVIETLVQPRVIVCNGYDESASAFATLRAWLSSSTAPAEWKEQDGLIWYNSARTKFFGVAKCSWRAGGVALVGLPHLSRYDPRAEGVGERVLLEIEDYLRAWHSAGEWPKPS